MTLEHPGWKLTCIRCGKVRAVLLGCECNDADYAHVMDVSPIPDALARLKALEEEMRVIVQATNTLEWRAITALPNEWADEIVAIRKALGADD